MSLSLKKNETKNAYPSSWNGLSFLESHFSLGGKNNPIVVNLDTRVTVMKKIVGSPSCLLMNICLFRWLHQGLWAVRHTRIEDETAPVQGSSNLISKPNPQRFREYLQ